MPHIMHVCVLMSADCLSLTISPRGTQIKNVNAGITFTCTLNDLPVTKKVRSLGWTSPSTQPIEETKGRWVLLYFFFVIHVYTCIYLICEVDAFRTKKPV